LGTSPFKGLQTAGLKQLRAHHCQLEVCQHLQVSSGRFDWHFSDVHCPRTAQKSPKRAILAFGHLRGGILCYRWGSGIGDSQGFMETALDGMDDLSTSLGGGFKHFLFSTLLGEII